MDFLVPAGFSTIEDWILRYIYDHPKEAHSTTSLRKQLESVLKSEPSQLAELNKHNKLFGSPEITAKEYDSLTEPEQGTVQRAIETLIKGGWAKGKRDSDDAGVVFFGGIALTNSGEREAISREREKETQRTPPRSFENSLRDARKRAGFDNDDG
ncbi:MAG: hypothetical protein ABSD13_19745 [Candidatus Korobacteraceae bacterium]|jgi:hypothetical protein